MEHPVRESRRLRTKLLLLFLLISPLPLILLGAAWLNIAHRAESAVVARRAREVTELATRQIEESAQSVESDLVDLGDVVAALDSSRSSTERIQDAVRRFAAARTRTIASLTVVGHGTSLAGVDQHPSQAVDVALKWPGSATTGWVCGREIECAGGCCVPIWVKPLGTELTLQAHYRLSDALRSIGLRLPFAEDAVFMVVDRAEIIRYHPDRHFEGTSLRALTNAPTARAAASPTRVGDGLYTYSGKTYFVSWRRSDPTLLTVIAIVHPGVVIETLVLYIMAAIGITLLVAVAAALAVLRFARSLTHGFEVIEAGLKEFAGGNLGARIQVRTGDELERLAGAFNTMAEEIGAQRRQIEHAHNERLQSERLVTIGTFTAVIAHELKNPLGAIKISAAVLHDKVAGDEEGRRMADIIQDEVERLDTKLLRVLGYARPAPAQLAPHVIGDVVERSVRYIERSISTSNIHILHERSPRPIHIRIDADQIHQVMVNLIINARDAIKTGGTITVRCGLEEPRWPEQHGLRPFITISDDGPGIPADFLNRIFEPFATTKPSGSGLGLAICRQIMTAHGGEIHVQSGGDVSGTQFALYFPVSLLEGEG